MKVDLVAGGLEAEGADSSVDRTGMGVVGFENVLGTRGHNVVELLGDKMFELRGILSAS